KELCITRDKILNFYKTKLNNTDHFINKYNQSDSWSDLKKGILLAILDFRSIEFYNEGLRWYDIVRWNIPVTHTQANGSKSSLMPDDDRRVLQIPEMATISGIKLNPRNNVNNSWE
ncbi:RagB/SusD family nutrient uptake outer membrane protein, partial [Bacteroides xylanisolvens]